MHTKQRVIPRLFGVALVFLLAACGGLTSCGSRGGGGSEAGTTWTARTSRTGSFLSSVTYGGGTFVAVGEYGAILTSP